MGIADEGPFDCAQHGCADCGLGEVMASKVELAPGLGGFTVECDPGVKAGLNGSCPVAMPAKTTVL